MEIWGPRRVPEAPWWGVSQNPGSWAAERIFRDGGAKIPLDLVTLSRFLVVVVCERERRGKKGLELPPKNLWVSWR